MAEETTSQEHSMSLPEHKAFFKIPARFGHVPVAEEPLGYDRERRFEQHYPRIELPFQLVDTVETSVKRRYDRNELFPVGLNRLFFGDKNEVRSFTDTQQETRGGRTDTALRRDWQ